LILIIVAACAPPAIAAQGQQRPGRGRSTPPSGATDDAGVSQPELQRLFDAYVLMQAQQELQLSDEQFPKFLARVKALQEVRRRVQTERLRVLRELRRVSQAAAADESQLRTQLKTLADLDTQAAADVRQAMDGVDQVLDVRQQARFRLFEEQMERRKFELLMRARQSNRQRNQIP
jgi:hypothetical protein